jgi:excisionase family DNA binding protein
MAKHSKIFDDQTLTVAQTAPVAHVTERTVRRWIADGRLPAYKVGPRRILIKRSDLEALVRGAA